MEKDGVFIANIVDYSFVKEVKSKVDLTGNSTNVYNQYEQKIKSYITFNNGGQWSPLQSETKNIHIHGDSSSFPKFYSISSAQGLILANGNVGEYLSNKTEEINTYISKDSGFTWKEVF